MSLQPATRRTYARAKKEAIRKESASFLFAAFRNFPALSLDYPATGLFIMKNICKSKEAIYVYGYLLLAVAIILEIFSTSMLKLSAGFTRPLPGSVFVLGMGLSFYALSQALLYLPLNSAYAIWSGVGTALTALVGLYIWKESINMYGLAGIALIIAGVVLLNCKTSAH